MAEFAPITSSLGTFSSVASAASSTTLLAANIKRKGATICNTDTNALCVRLDGGTATVTSGFNVRLATNAYYEVPYGYTGAIVGIWEADGAGFANMIELT